MRTSYRVIISATGGLLLTAGSVGIANANLVQGLLGQPPAPSSPKSSSTPPPPDGG